MSANKKKLGFLIAFSRHLFLALMALGTVFLLFNLLVDWSDSTDYFPTPVLGDELFYYRIVDGFTHYGFILGNNGVSYNEVSANLGPFSAHGPFYIYFYSLVAHILGWSPFNAIATNIFIISFAVYALLVAKIKVETKIILAFVLLFYFPFTLFFTYFMMETFNHFIMMILFLILFRFLIDPYIISFKHIILIFLAVFFFSLFRVTYFVFYFAIIAYVWKNIVFHERASLLFLALFLTMFAYFAIHNLSSPYPNFMSQKVDLLINFEVFNFFNDIGVRFLNNLYYLATSSSRIDKGFFSIYLLSFVWAMINISRNRLYLFVAIVLISPFFIIFSLYDVDFYRALRVLSHFLFFSILCFVVIGSKSSRRLVVLIVFGTSLSAYVSNNYITQNTWKFIGKPNVGEFVKNVNHITSDVGRHRWDNTISLDIEYGYDLDLIFNLNKHLGLNFNLNSNYLLTRCSMWILTKKQDRVDVLFYNLILKSGDNFLFKRVEDQSESCEPATIPQKRRPESLKFS